MADPYDELEALDPSDSMADTLAAVRALLDLVDKDGAGEIRNKALSLISRKEGEAMEYYLRPLDDDSLYNRLIAHCGACGDESGIAQYRRALDIRQARKWTVLGDAQAVIGNNTKAAVFLKRAMFFGPMEEVLGEVQGALDRAEKRVEKAKREIEKVLSRAKSDPSPKTLKEATHHLLDLDRVDEADEMNGLWLSIEPDGTDPLFQKGCILFAKGDHEGALEIFEGLRDRLPDSLNVKRCYNWTLHMLGRDQV